MPVKKPKPLTALTPREHEVAKLVTEGHSNKVIAAKLFISEYTAKFHVYNIIFKMGANSRVDAAVKYALAERNKLYVPQEVRFGTMPP